jgi:hypothetical protein
VPRRCNAMAGHGVRKTWTSRGRRGRGDRRTGCRAVRRGCAR